MNSQDIEQQDLFDSNALDIRKRTTMDEQFNIYNTTLSDDLIDFKYLDSIDFSNVNLDYTFVNNNHNDDTSSTPTTPAKGNYIFSNSNKYSLPSPSLSSSATKLNTASNSSTHLGNSPADFNTLIESLNQNKQDTASSFIDFDNLAKSPIENVDNFFNELLSEENNVNSLPMQRSISKILKSSETTNSTSFPTDNDLSQALNDYSFNFNIKKTDGDLFQLSSPKQTFVNPSLVNNISTIDSNILLSKNENFPTVDNNTSFYTTKNSKVLKRKSASSIPNIRRQSIVDIHKNRRQSTIGTSTSDIGNDEDLDKQFKCSECEKGFKRSEHLKRHFRSVHSNERPFPCMLCEKKFSRSDNLSQHLKTHKKHGDF
ncbi:hypothetical protein KAFR_0F02070 [Kazachstania africana CBS 2517]|uniref:C2H2-type domain-containing protein n=1 Tax=Kazachstania africana (strain ATCC 22294 / BCRC 22015 / CBS 2517 / CECT 1963 / NBRC 1671 / NRRL Y-8276) TaxID=1071382 RepID=H2AWQ4_KAZAF|nr:hypothetical protein KAFR_0F02070 [Kazachstania africana CBS 2517]CCF58804.1 hypothetical protein KAFR_0F02070 [Kazachstania africana CBS 2517]